MLLTHQHIVKHNVADAQYLIFDMGILPSRRRGWRVKWHFS